MHSNKGSIEARIDEDGSEQRNLERKRHKAAGGLLAGFGLVILLLVGSAGVSYLNTRQLRFDSMAVDQTHQVLAALENLLTAVVDAETGQRGYLITGDESYLEPYDNAILSVQRLITNLDAFTADNSRQQERIPAIKEAVDAKLKELASTLAVFNQQGLEAAQAVVQDDSGKREMEEVRATIMLMERAERELLDLRTERTERTFHIAVLSGLITTILGLTAVGMVAHFVYRSHQDREIAANRLLQEREKLDVTLNSIGDGVIAADTQGRITIINGVAANLTGWTQDAALGQPLTSVFRIVSEATNDPVDNPVQRALAEGTVVGLTTHADLIAKDGSRRSISDSAAPIRSPRGELRGAVLVIRDVTAARELERELEFRHRLLELTVDVGSALVAGESFDDSLQRCCESLIDHVEGAVARIWTYEENAERLQLRASAGSAVRPNDPHQSVRLGEFKIGRIAESRKAYTANWLIGDPMFPDQEWVQREQLVSFAGFPLVVGQRLLGVMAVYARRVLPERSLRIIGAVAKEIAVGVDRQRALAEDQESRRLQEITLESIGDGVITTDVAGRVLFLNRVAEQISGWTSKQAIGKPAKEVFRLVDDFGAPILTNPIEAIIQRGVRLEQELRRLKTREPGREAPIEMSGAPILIDGEVVGAVIVFRDTSDRLQNQREKEQLLRRADTERRRLEAVLEALPAGVIIADADGRLTHMNSAVRTIWGDSTPMSQGINEYGDWKGWWPETGQRIEADEWAMARALTTGEVCLGEEVIIERFDGGRATIINSASPIRDVSGAIVGGVVAELDITELAETQAALRDARSRLNALLEAGEIGTWEWDIESNFVYSDSNLDSMFGRVEAANTGVPLETYLRNVHSEDRQRVWDTIHQAVKTSDRIEVDYRVKDVGGGTRWVVARGRIEDDAAGRPSRATGMVIDVTDRRRAEIALAESRQFLAESLDALPSHIAVLDKKGEILIVNRAWREFAANNDFQGDCYGVGSNYLDACDDQGHGNACDEGTAASEGIRRVLSGDDQYFDLEYPCHSETEKRWFLMRVNRFDSSGGLRVIVSHEDITTRVLAELSVRESEEKFRTLADNISQFAWMADAEGWIFWYNKRWFDYTGTTLEEMQGWGWTKVHHPDHVDRVVKKIERHWKTGDVWEDTFPLRGKDGAYRWFLSRANPIYDPDGRIIRWFGTNTDITKHRELEQALLDAGRRKDQFLATLGHELRNPLAGILGGISVLQSNHADETVQREAQQIIMRQSRFMERLVDDLVDVSRIARGKITLRTEVVELGRLMTELVSDLRHAFEEHAIKLDYTAPEDPVYCQGDRERLRQVFTNLLNNAKKFTDREGSVRLALAPTNGGDAVTVIVADTGIGMEAETLRSIFEPFVQADVSLERSKGGLGLGMAIVQGIVELHGGYVTAASEGLGKGSTISVKLPIVVGERETKQEPAPELSPYQIPLTVLIVDDRRDASYALMKYMEHEGHQVHIAKDGPGAVKTAIEVRPDVTICDIGLPGFDGYEVARRIRAADGFDEALLIAVTGYGQPADKRAAESAGFDCHFVKPVDREQLVRAVANWAAANRPIR